VKKVDEWGMRELAYRIRHEYRGFYALIEYSGEPAVVRELERQLRLSDQVLRFLTVRPGKVKPPAPRRSREPSAGEERESGA
jgi:small subunit ribosomal protein S6